MTTKTLLPHPEVVWYSLSRETRRRIANAVLAGGDIDKAVTHFCPDLRDSRVGLLRRFLREERSKPWGGAMGN